MFKDIRKGCDRLSYTEIDAYSRVTGLDLSSWEVSTMMQIDEVWNSG